jgi:pyruvate dehydrogenase complex dehydrogenase (E1) component
MQCLRELAVILDHGMREMMERQEDVFYYVTLMNENYAQPSLPAGVESDLIVGCTATRRMRRRRRWPACGCSARARSCAK